MFGAVHCHAHDQLLLPQEARASARTATASWMIRKGLLRAARRAMPGLPPRCPRPSSAGEGRGGAQDDSSGEGGATPVPRPAGGSWSDAVLLQEILDGLTEVVALGHPGPGGESAEPPDVLLGGEASRA